MWGIKEKKRKSVRRNREFKAQQKENSRWELNKKREGNQGDEEWK